jgi:iron(III) transport system ATP-binding protein
MVFQSYALFPHLSVLDNVSYGLKLRKFAPGQIREKAERALALLELTPQRDKHPGQLSGGQQQRVALARALVLEPELILLDEPLSNLDAELRVVMRAEIRALQQRLGITAIYVTHDQEEAMAISDRIVVMNAGRIEQMGTPIELYRRPRTEFVARFMGSPNIFAADFDSAGRLTLWGETLAGTYHAGTSHIVIRSDALQFDEHGRYRATVESVTFLGARTEYHLRVGGVRLLVDRPSDSNPLTPGSEVRFDIAVDRLHFLQEP